MAAAAMRVATSGGEGGGRRGRVHSEGKEASGDDLKRAPVAPARGRGSGCMARLVHGRGCGGEEAAAKAAKRAVRARR